MAPHADLTDPLGTAILSVFQQNAIDPLIAYISSRLTALDDDRAALRQELYLARWGPTRIPIYNVVLFFLHTSGFDRVVPLAVTRLLARDLCVPVDGSDVTGSTALYWAISSKPYAQIGFAQILFDVGGSVNQRNRFGCTAASEIVQGTNADMMRWFVEHGGDVEQKDNDGMSPMMLVNHLGESARVLREVIERGRGDRDGSQCTNCGRVRGVEQEGLMQCKRCRGVRYCGVECQTVDWRGHRSVCRAMAA